MSNAQGNDHHNNPEGSKPPEEYTIPKATITRIMRQVLPQDSRVTSGAKETMDQCIVEFSAPMSKFLRLYCENANQQAVAPPRPPAPPAPVAPSMEEETAVPPPPPSPDLTLQLGLPSVPDVTELAPRTDVYTLWHGGAPAVAGHLAGADATTCCC
ncbi:uncharacterized protein [Miscanthus floridulus]|uniref:uncharacterized protein n=1 Tax=Miscanthus floridulus TaxID=154761 RepID=UPI003457B023